MRQYKISFASGVLLAAFTISVANARIVLFDFEDQVFGATTALASTQNGLTATFASPTDLQGFQISGGFYQTLTGNYLASPGPDFVTGNTLTIAFSQGVRAIRLNFATDTDPTLSLVADNGGAASATGTAPGGFFLYPEGVLAYSGGFFRSVALSSAALSFAIDNVSVTVAEPSAFALLGVAALGVGVVRRRSTLR